MSLSAIEVSQLKQAPAVDGVLPAVLGRWSARSFADRQVSDADLLKVFQAARWSASAYNEQPWRFLVGKRGSATYDKIFSTLIGFNQSWAGKASVLILGIASTKFSHNGSENPYALYDLGAAASLLTLQAAALGLNTHSMAGFDHDAARKVFEIPADYTPGAVIALGYQGEPATLGNEPRERKPLDELVLSAWGTSAEL